VSSSCSSSSQEGLASLLGLGADAYDPFEDASRYYHKVPAEDAYGERCLQAFAARARARDADAQCAGYYLVRRSNSDAFSSVSLTYLAASGTQPVGHCKISHDQDRGCWRVSASWAGLPAEGERDWEEEVREAPELDTLLHALLERHGYAGVPAAVACS